MNKKEIAVILVTIALFSLDNATVGAQSVPTISTKGTRIFALTATENDGIMTISGVVQYQNSSGGFIPLNSVKVVFSLWQLSSSSTQLIGQVYSSASDGSFNYAWNDGLEPGRYYINATYPGGDVVNGYYLSSSQWTTQVLVPLQLNINLDNPTLSVGQSGSATVTITVTAANSGNAHPISLSATTPSQLTSNIAFSPQTGSTPVTSKMTINVQNVTQPGTYVVTVTATSQEGTLPQATATASLQILVQQLVHTVTVSVLGLPQSMQTSLYLDNSFIENLGTGTVTLTISNYTSVISVSKELDSGGSRYTCNQYSQPATSTSDGFSYDTEYELVITSQLPKISKLTLIVNGTDQSQEDFGPYQGFAQYFPQYSVIDFSATLSYNTGIVDYRLSNIKDQTTGGMLNPVNVTVSNMRSMYEVTLTRPYNIMAYYDEWARVSITTNLPPDISVRLQVGVAGGTNRTVNLVGSNTYLAGEFPVGSTFECDVQNQLPLYNSGGDVRYQLVQPSVALTLESHSLIQLNFTIQYRVLVLNRFPSVTVQPSGGVGWYAPGDLATVQVEPSTSDAYGVPYVFSGWSGQMSANDTTVTFPVTVPIDVIAEWAPNWSYILTLVLVAFAIAVPLTLIAKRKLRGWRSRLKSKSKSSPKKREGKNQSHSGKDLDLKLYNYIIANGGSLKLADAIDQLGMSREEIAQAVARLKKSHMLG